MDYVNVQAFPNSTAVSAMNKVADSIVCALPVEDDDDDGGIDEEMMIQED
jgi:hypothetical protein